MLRVIAFASVVACSSSSSAPATTAPPAPARAPAPTPTPTPGPGMGESCGAGDVCGSGTTCVSYYGVAGARGPQFKTCEIRCKDDSACPSGHTCSTIADGPGQVCR